MNTFVLVTPYRTARSTIATGPAPNATPPAAHLLAVGVHQVLVRVGALQVAVLRLQLGRDLQVALVVLDGLLHLAQLFVRQACARGWRW